MEYNIYCDESCHLENDKQSSMVIGGIWVPKDKKGEISKRIKEIKERHELSKKIEIKWVKVSKSKVDFYLDLVDYFFDNPDLHFRAIIVPDKGILNHKKYSSSHNEWYYKIYFDMLKNIINSDSLYNIFIDVKDSQGGEKIKKLHKVLSNNIYDFDSRIVKKIQLVRSDELSCLQLADLLIGALSYLHRGVNTNSGKIDVINRIKKRSGLSLMKNTLYRVEKVNILVWEPKEND